MVTWACQAAATDWSARPICSMAATKPTVDMPIPPHSSGISMPSRPELAHLPQQVGRAAPPPPTPGAPGARSPSARSRGRARPGRARPRSGEVHGPIVPIGTIRSRARSRRRRAGRRGRHHRHLPAAPGPRGRVLGDPARGRRRRRRHLVLEPLPRGPVRLGELHLRLPLLPGAVRRLGVAGALRRAARDRALPEPRRRPVRPPSPHPLRRPGHLGGLGRPVGDLGRDRRRRRRRCGPGSWSRPPASSRCRTSPTCRGGRTSPASRSTPASGRRSGVDVRGQAGRRHRHRVQRRAGDPRHPRRGRLPDRLPAHRQLVHPAQQRARSRPRSRRSCGPTSRRCARC